MIPNIQRIELMLLAGVLHDISENTTDYMAAKQTHEAMGKIYKILGLNTNEIPAFKNKNFQ